MSSLFRYRFASRVLSADTTWGNIGYDGGTNGGGVGILGEWAVMQTNFVASQVPCRLVVANINTGQSFTATPFKTSISSTSYSFSKAALDVASGHIYAQDTGTGVVVAAHIASTGIVSDWKIANVSNGFIFLQGPDNNRQVIMPNSTSTGDQLIWRDPVSGAVLAKTPVLTSTPTQSPITPGFAGRVYYPAIQSGKLIEVVPTRSAPESSDWFLGLRPI
ncbi:MAG: hypothetical protein H7Y22_07430 [Gemmatimonadaceae bacterium]|nr:hypothetical protein [Gloeobacterales cyanobacterium ES-bin-141]